MLTLPLAIAAISAGLVGGVHCVGMCGGISTMLVKAGINRNNGQSKNIIPLMVVGNSANASLSKTFNASANLRYQVLLHSGRITTYVLIGIVFGSLGAAGMLFRPYAPIQQLLFTAGNLALIILGMRLLGVSLPNISIVRSLAERISALGNAIAPAIKTGSNYPFLVGMSWGCLPCGLLYTVAPFSLLSGDGVSGGILMLLFGITALPHLLITQGLLRSNGEGRLLNFLRISGAILLVFIGLMGLWYFDMKGMPDFLCVVPST